MKIQRPIFWHHGLFLQPQHFQLQDQAVHSRLIPFLKYHSPHFWGVCAADIDEAALGSGSFILDSGAFLFQDGSYLEIPGNALISPRRFEGAQSEGKPLKVYLGLKRWNNGAENVTVVDSSGDIGSATTRFVSVGDPDEVRDLYRNGPDAQVNRLHHLLRLFWEDELDQLGDYHLIPLARVEGFGGTRLSPAFVPPSLTISASPPLLKLVREIRDQLAARTRQLAQYKNQRGVQNVEFGCRDMVYLLALRTLNRQVPHLFHLIEAETTHPWVLYGALRQLAGELSSFSVAVDMLGEGADGSRLLPAYDHQNLAECFAAARDLITRLLQEITAGPDYVVPLLKEGAFFTGALTPSLLEGGKRYFLALTSGEEPTGVVQSVDSVAKLSAREHLPMLASRALPGLPLQYLQTPPQELPRRARTLYFAVDHHHQQWEMVANSHAIALHWDTAPADLEVELMVLEKMRHSAE